MRLNYEQEENLFFFSCLSCSRISSLVLRLKDGRWIILAQPAKTPAVRTYVSINRQYLYLRDEEV